MCDASSRRLRRVTVGAPAPRLLLEGLLPCCRRRLPCCLLRPPSSTRPSKSSSSSDSEPEVEACECGWQACELYVWLTSHVGSKRLFMGSGWRWEWLAVCHRKPRHPPAHPPRCCHCRSHRGQTHLAAPASAWIPPVAGISEMGMSWVPAMREQGDGQPPPARRWWQPCHNAPPTHKHKHQHTHSTITTITARAPAPQPPCAVPPAAPAAPAWPAACRPPPWPHQHLQLPSLQSPPPPKPQLLTQSPPQT